MKSRVPKGRAPSIRERLDAVERKLIPPEPVEIAADDYLDPGEVERLAAIMEQLPAPDPETGRPDFTHVPDALLAELDELLEILAERCPAARGATFTYPVYETSPDTQNPDVKEQENEHGEE